MKESQRIRIDYELTACPCPQPDLPGLGGSAPTGRALTCRYANERAASQPMFRRRPIPVTLPACGTLVPRLRVHVTTLTLGVP